MTVCQPKFDCVCVCVCGPAGVPGARRLILLWGRAAWCARGRRPAREPSAQRASLGVSPRSPARPRHRPRAPQPGPLVPSGPSTPVGPGRCLEPYSWPRPRAPQPGPLGLPAPSVPVGPDVLMGGCSDDGMFGCALLQTSSIQGVFVWIPVWLLQTSSIQRLIR